MIFYSKNWSTHAQISFQSSARAKILAWVTDFHSILYSIQCTHTQMQIQNQITIHTTPLIAWSLFCTTTCYLLFSEHCISKYQIQDKYKKEEITCSREMMENNFTTDHQSLQSLHKWQNFRNFSMFAVSAESNCAGVCKLIVEPVFA